jgi:hypothetical protein
MMPPVNLPSRLAGLLAGLAMLALPALAKDGPTSPPRPRIIIRCGGGGWKDGQVQEPCILANPKNPRRLIMFYAGMTLGGREGALAKAWADVADPFTWHEDPHNPILLGKSGDLLRDPGFTRLDSVVYHEASDEYWIYYTGNSATAPREAIGLATCPAGKDGYSEVVKARIKPYAGRPILSPKSPGRSDENCVSQGAVFRENGRWYLFYSYRTASETLPGIRLATSADGRHWTKVPGPDLLTAAPEQRYIEWHQVRKIGDRYLLLWEGYRGGTRWGAAVATSSCLTGGWKKLPVGLIDQTRWPGYSDALYHVATPAIYRIGGKWYLFFQGAHLGGEYGWQHWTGWCIECDDVVRSILLSCKG